MDGLSKCGCVQIFTNLPKSARHWHLPTVQVRHQSILFKQKIT